MAQLHLSLSDEQLEALETIASARQVAVLRLLEDYVSYLLIGGEPVEVSFAEIGSDEIARIAERGGSLDWLADEPEIYSRTDGEPV